MKLQKSKNIKRIEHNRERIQEQYNLGVEDFNHRKEDLKIYLKSRG